MKYLLQYGILRITSYNVCYTKLLRPMLVAAGWGVTPGSRIRREYPITLGRLEGNGKRGKTLSADYVLEYRNTKLAVVEAKAWDKSLTAGVGQAKDYANKLAIRRITSYNVCYTKLLRMSEAL